MQIWFLISEPAKWALIAYQSMYYPYIPLQPPVDRESPITYGVKLESQDEVTKFMKAGARQGRLPKHLR